MFSIFSTQNLQTFLRRKNLRPPSRGGPPGPERLPNRGPERGPSWRGPSDRGLSLGADPSTAGAGVLVSSLISCSFFLFWPEFISPARLHAALNILHTDCRGIPLRPWQEFHSPRAQPPPQAQCSLSCGTRGAA